MTPAGRKNYLTNRPPAVRARILAKVREYEALDRTSANCACAPPNCAGICFPPARISDRTVPPQLAAIPDDLRALVIGRLMQWDILPPPFQKEFLESDRDLALLHARGSVQQPAGCHRTTDGSMARRNRFWRTGMRFLEDQRQKVTAQFNQFLN